MTHEERNEPVERFGTVVTVTDLAVCLFDDMSEREIFFPRRYIKRWFFTDMGTDRGWPIGTLERGDDVTLVIPRWLAERENLM